MKPPPLVCVILVLLSVVVSVVVSQSPELCVALRAATGVLKIRERERESGKEEV